MSGEFELIRRFFLPLATAPGALGLGDDAALLSADPTHDLVVTTDTIVESVHYLASDPVDSVGGKLLGVNLSDLAAMGAEPLAYLLAIALPQTWSAGRREGWLTAFTRGLAAMQPYFRLGLLGGDTVAMTGGPCLTATAIGSVPAGAALRRSGAVAGDLVFVSGTIGDAALGLQVLTGEMLPGVDAAGVAELIDRYRWPRPRVDLGRRLRGLAHAAADVSDGLIADLGHICRASGVQAVVDAAEVPLSGGGRQALDANADVLRLILGGGDDYELVFTAPVANRGLIAQAAADAAVAVNCIGAIIPPVGYDPSAPVRVVVAGTEVTAGRAGYEHFSRDRNK